MAQPPQMRQGPPGPPPQHGMPPGPPGPQGPGQAPFGHPGQQPYGPPGQQPFAPPGQPGPVRPTLPPGGLYGGGMPPQAPEGWEPPKKKKSKKRGRPSHDEWSSDEEDEGHCPCPQQPATQIFITPPGCPPWPPCPPGQPTSPGVNNGNGNGKNPSNDPYDLCKLYCYPGVGPGQSNIQPQVICCPPAAAPFPTQATDWCVCCKCKKKCKRTNKQPQADWCGTKVPVEEEGWCGTKEPGRKGRPAVMDEMMPASQQFLMFLQAYGLAAALIRDRGRREEERQEREWQERRQERAKSADSSKKGKNQKEEPKKQGKKKKKEEDFK